MEVKDLKKIVEKLDDFKVPSLLEEELKATLGDPVPPIIKEFFNAYQNAYLHLTDIHNEIKPLIDEATANNKKEVEENPILLARVYAAQSNFRKIHVDLDIEVNRQVNINANQPIVSTVNGTNRILLTTASQTLSDNAIATNFDQIQIVLDIANQTTFRKADLEQLNDQLRKHGFNPLDENFINKVFYNDYGRQSCVFKKEYRLVLANSIQDNENIIKENEFFVALEEEALSYAVIGPDKEIKKGKIKKEILVERLGDRYPVFADALKKPENLDTLKSFLPDLLKITHALGDTLENELPSTFTDQKTSRASLENFIAGYLNVLKIAYPKLSDNQISSAEKQLKIIVSILSQQGSLPYYGESSIVGTFSLNCNYTPPGSDSILSEVNGNQLMIPTNKTVSQSSFSYSGIPESNSQKFIPELKIESCLYQDQFIVQEPNTSMAHRIDKNSISTKIALSLEPIVGDETTDKITFRIRSPEIDLAIRIPPENTASFCVLVDSSTLIEPHKIIDQSHIDYLRPCLDNIVKFLGHPSLEEIIYKKKCDDVGKSDEKKRLEAKKEVKNQIFDITFIKNDLEIKDEIEKKFLIDLNKNYYENHIGKDASIKNICDFFAEQFPKVPYPDKARYFSLLKMAEQLGAKPEEIEEIRNKALDEAFNSEMGLTQTEVSFLKENYKKFYEDDISPNELNQKIKNFLAEAAQTLIKDFGVQEIVEILCKLSNPQLDLFKESKIKEDPQDLIKKDVGVQETVENLCKPPNSQSTLFEAAKKNKAIYQEMIEPEWTASYLFRAFRERLPAWLGGIPPRPRFSSEQQLELLATHHELLSDLNNNQPYQEILSRVRRRLDILPPIQKVTFLKQHIKLTENNEKSRLNALTKIHDLGNDFFNEALINHLKDNNFQALDNLIAQSNPLLPGLLRASSDMGKLQVLFDSYDKHEDASVASVQKRLEQIVNFCKKNEICNKASVIKAFGEAFITNFTAHLKTLIGNVLNNYVKEFDELCKIFEKAPWLLESDSFLKELTPESKDFILKGMISQVQPKMLMKLRRLPQWDSSVESIKARLTKIIQSYHKNELPVQKFDEKFMQVFKKDLNELALRKNPNEFALIAEIFEKNSELCQKTELLSSLQAIINNQIKLPEEKEIPKHKEPEIKINPSLESNSLPKNKENDNFSKHSTPKEILKGKEKEATIGSLIKSNTLQKNEEKEINRLKKVILTRGNNLQKNITQATCLLDPSPQTPSSSKNPLEP